MVAYRCPHILGQLQLTFDTHVEEVDMVEGRMKLAQCFKVVTPDSVVHVIAESDEDNNRLNSLACAAMRFHGAAPA